MQIRCEKNLIRYAINCIEVNRLEVKRVKGDEPITVQVGFRFGEPDVRIRNIVLRKNAD